MLRQTVAGGIDRMGRVAKPETPERAPRYEYNPGYIVGATQLPTRGYPDQQPLTLPSA